MANLRRAWLVFLLLLLPDAAWAAKSLGDLTGGEVVVAEDRALLRHVRDALPSGS